jgi:hypothetical protein
MQLLQPQASAIKTQYSPPAAKSILLGLQPDQMGKSHALNPGDTAGK